MDRKSLEAGTPPSPTTFLSLVREVAADAARQPDPDACLRRLRAGLIHLGFRRAGIWITEPANPTTLRGTWGTGWDGTEVDEHGLTLPIGEFASSERIVAGERLVVVHLSPPADLRLAHVGTRPQAGPTNHASVALRADGHLLGLISVDMLPGDEEIDVELVAALELVADQIAVAIARARTVAELRAANDSLVDELAKRRASEERLQSVFDNVPIGLYRTTLDGQTVEANATLLTMLGFPDLPTLRNVNVADLVVNSEDREREHQILAREGVVRGFELQARRRDGTFIWLDDWSRVVLGADGKPLFYDGSLQDITQRKNLADQLRQTQKMEAIGQLAGGVAHDFNNLLTVIMGYGEILASEFPANTPEREAVEQILLAGGNAALLTRQLLDFSQRQIVAPREINLNDVVVQLGKMLRRLIGEDIVFNLALSSELGLVHADPGQVEQVLLNLASNARDAMPRGGQLTITTANVTPIERNGRGPNGAAPGPYVTLEVKDTGTGMDHATQARIFEPFFTTKEVGKGTGLGLSAVVGIVTQSGGWLDVASEVGRGSTFTLYIPRVDPVASTRREATQRETLPRGTETILLVEDETLVRRLAQRVLQANGYTVLSAGDSTEATLLADRNVGTIDLLIADVVMPGMGGRQVAELLLARQPTLRVLYMSGYTEDVVIRHGISETTVNFLQKPFTPTGLIRTVRAALDAPISP